MDWFGVLKRKEGSEEQDHEHLLVTDEDVHAEEGHRDQIAGQDVQKNWVDGLLATALPLAFLFFAYSIVLYWQAKHILATDTKCTKRMSGYSPMIDAIEYERIQWHVEDFPDEYSGNQLWRLRAHGIVYFNNNFGFPREKLEALNKSSSRQYISTGDKNDGEIVGLLEGFHQMHCLNLVRKYIYRSDWNYYEYDYSFQKGEWHLRTHVDHCITIMKESITCAGDVTLVLFERDLAGPDIWKPHSSVQKCRRWSSIIDWVKDHRAVSEDELDAKLQHPVLEKSFMSL